MAQDDSRPQSSPDAETMPAPRSGGSVASGFTSGAQMAHPERIAGYRVQRVLGQGGMGVVYLARRDDSSFAQQVALKVIKRGMDSDDIVKRFELERKVLSGLNHPNIARLMDGGTTEDGRPYFALEYVEGQPLDKYCDSQRLSTRDRIALFRKVCAAVHYAHQNLIVHRDLKPGNILVTSTGEPKLLDFGIAKLLNASLFEVTEMTGPGVRLMTPEYASPEQVRGDPITTASDVYSLGVMLYELLTGRRPYKFKTRLQHEIMRIVCEEEPEKPSTVISRAGVVALKEGPEPQPPSDAASSKQIAELREGDVTRLRRRLQGDVDDIVLKALEKSPGRRYTSAEQLAEDLQRHIEGQPVIARPASVAYRLEKFVRRNRGAVAAGVALVLALSAGVAGTTIQWRSAVAARQVAVLQRNAAEEQRALAEAAGAEALKQKGRAESAWNELWSLSTRFIDQFHESVVKLPGSIPARELLVNTGVEYMDKLLAQAGDDLDKQLTISGIYERMGQIQGDLRSGNKGDVGQAMVHQRKAQEIRQRILAARPDDPRAMLASATSLLRIGDLQVMSGQRDESVKSYEQALPLLRRLEGDTKDAVPALQRIAAILSKLGDARVAAGDLRGAEQQYLEADKVRVRVLALDPSPLAKRNLSAGQMDLARLWGLRGEFDRAIERSSAAVETRRELLAAEPEHSRTRRDLGAVLQEHARLLVSAGRGAEARAAAEESVALMAALVEGEKASPDARNRFMMGRAHGVLGEALALLDMHQESLAANTAAAAVLEPLSEASKDNADYRSALADAWGAQGAELVALSRPTEALLALERSRGVLESMARGSPGDVDVQRSLALRLAQSAAAAAALARDEREARAARRRWAEQGLAWAGEGLKLAEEVSRSQFRALAPSASPEALGKLRDSLQTLSKELAGG